MRGKAERLSGGEDSKRGTWQLVRAQQPLTALPKEPRQGTASIAPETKFINVSVVLASSNVQLSAGILIINYY